MTFNKPMRLLLYLLTFIVGVWGGDILIKRLTTNPTEAERQLSTLINQTAPDFSLADMNNVIRNRCEWDNKVVILNFWATWCPPCRRETPTFVALQDEYGSQGVQFVGVAIDTKTKVEDFIDTYGINYPMLIGEQAAIDIAKAYGNRIGGLPYTVIIDRQGIIRFIQRGELTRDIAVAQISHYR